MMNYAFHFPDICSIENSRLLLFLFSEIFGKHSFSRRQAAEITRITDEKKSISAGKHIMLYYAHLWPGQYQSNVL
jgi:hypothetical protein